MRNLPNESGPPERGPLTCKDDHETCEAQHTSNRLTERGFLRRTADDFNTGFHLEVGESIHATDESLGRLEGTTATSLPEPHQRRASVDPRYGLGLLASANGVSGYPDPYPEPVMGGDLWAN